MDHSDGVISKQLDADHDIEITLKLCVEKYPLGYRKHSPHIYSGDKWCDYSYKYGSICSTFESCDKYLNNKYIMLLNDLADMLHAGESAGERFSDTLQMVNDMLDYKIKVAYSHVYQHQDDIEFNIGSCFMDISRECDDDTCECKSIDGHDILEIFARDNPGHEIKILMFGVPLKLSPECHEILDNGDGETLFELYESVSYQFFHIFNSAEPYHKSCH